ncbi:MAG: hypothetical protein ACSLE9_00775 [Burkholderiaceae bacterium]
MSFIKSGELAQPELATETVAVEPLGGDVRVRAMLLSERLGMERRLVRLRKEAGDKGAADENSWLAVVPDVLELCVLDADKRPVFSRSAWENFGASHLGVAVQLFNVAWRLSGMAGDEGDDPAKN